MIGKFRVRFITLSQFLHQFFFIGGLDTDKVIIIIEFHFKRLQIFFAMDESMLVTYPNCKRSLQCPFSITAEMDCCISFKEFIHSSIRLAIIKMMQYDYGHVRIPFYQFPKDIEFGIFPIIRGNTFTRFQMAA